MDLKQLSDTIVQASELGRTIQILDAQGNPYLAADGITPCTCTVLGAESKRVKAAKDANQRRLLRARRAKLEPADLRDGRVRVVIAAMTAWTGWQDGNAEAQLTPANITTLCGIEDHLRQLEEAIEEGADFFGSSSST